MDVLLSLLRTLPLSLSAFRPFSLANCLLSTPPPLFLSVYLHSGGISLKPSSGMDAMRADMGGAATVCASIVTAAALKLPINIIGEAAC